MKRIIYLLMLLPMLSVGQDFEKIDQLILSGTACLENEGTLCRADFDASLILASQLADSFHLQYYVEISHVYGNVGTDQEQWIFYAHKGLEKARELDMPRFEWLFLDILKETSQFLGDLKLTEAYSDSCLLLSRKLENPELQFKSLMSKSLAKQNQGQFSEALRFLLEAKDVGENKVENYSENKLKLNLAALYGRNRDLDLAEKYFEESFYGFMSEGDTSFAMVAHVNWCNVLISNGKTEKAIELLPMNIEYFHQKNAKSRVIFPMAQLGRALMDMGRFGAARKHLIDAASISDRLEIVQQGAYIKMLLSRCELELGMKEAALLHAKAAFDHHSEQGVSEEYISAFERYALALEANEQYASAIAVLKDIRIAEDSMFNVHKTREIAQIQEQLETEKKELQLCAQENEINGLEEQAKRIKTRNTGLLIGLFFTGLLAYLLVKRKATLVKLKQSENEKLKLIVESKNKQLTEKALHLAQKNEMLNSLKKELISMEEKTSNAEVKTLSNKIKFDEQIDHNWEQFTKAFTETKTGFFKTLTNRHPSVTKNDMRLSALLSMNLGSKNIASILNISDAGVKKARYRLRKKLELDSEASIEKYLSEI